MFADRLRSLMQRLEITNKQMAEYSKLDPSSVSRLHNGVRILPAESATIRKVIHGICLYADESGKTGTLCDLTGTDPALSGDALEKKVSAWLYADHTTPQSRSGKSGENNTSGNARRTARKQFGEKFNAVMEISEMSNIALSRKAHVDPSLISRYRAGLRSPVSNHDITELLSSVLYRNISESGKLNALAQIMNTRADLIDETSFSEWLCASEYPADNSIASTEKLLDALENHMTLTQRELSDADLMLLEETPAECLSEYIGYDGFRAAVIRFLQEAAHDHAKELLLFSNQNMEWMTADPAFLRKWALLMSGCIRNGTRIRIIHNIDRNLDEMNSAIISWLPLYMSGMIEPYYPTLSSGSLFSNTIFLNPGKACVNASLVSGTESEGIYRYDTDEARLTGFADQFAKMLDHARPLVSISTTDKPLPPTGDCYIIMPGLSLLSMPKETAASFGSGIYMEKWDQINRMSDEVFEHRICECITLSDPEAVKEGKVRAECIPGYDIENYTPESYEAHLTNMIKLMNTYAGYRPVILPDMPFMNMQLMISEDYVRITRTIEPFIQTTFTHPMMCQAFVNYAERLIRHYRTDRRTTIARLKEHLDSDRHAFTLPRSDASRS